MRKCLRTLLLFLIFTGCSARKPLVVEKPRPFVSDNWKLEITHVDVSDYPKINLRGIVLDTAGNVVKNLAPPFGHLDDWQQIWIPLVQQHPVWGEKIYHDFTVIENQFEEGDTTTNLYALRKKKANIERQIRQGRDIYRDVIERVKRRKQQMPAVKRELMAQSSVVLVLDISGSMSGEPLAKAKMAAVEFLAFSDAEIALIAFDDRVVHLSDFSRDKNHLTSAVLSLKSRGGTQLYDAVYEAIKMLRTKEGEKHILALTDGQTSGDSYTLQEIINFANSGNIKINAKTGDHVKIFTVGLKFSGTNLTRLSEQTGGEHYFADSPTELLAIFSKYIGFDLEQTHASTELSFKLQMVNSQIEQTIANINKYFYYDIKFTSRFPIEDGLNFRIGFKFGNQEIWQTIKIPVSKKELAVRGYVIDLNSKEKIPYATVTINPQMVDTTFSVSTDSSGYFESKVIRTANKYSVFAQAPDYFISAKEYKLAKPDSYYVTVQLKLKKAQVGAKAVMRSVHFENNEFLFEPVSIPDLMSMGGFLVQYPEYKFQISGHTDSFGKASYNQWLSEKRAEAVAEFFVGLGVPEENIQIRGYGESKRLFPDTNEQNRYMNRRVEIKLIEIDHGRVVNK